MNVKPTKLTKRRGQRVMVLGTRHLGPGVITKVGILMISVAMEDTDEVVRYAAAFLHDLPKRAPQRPRQTRPRPPRGGQPVPLPSNVISLADRRRSA